MISILIPCYNYPSVKLVEALYKQCKSAKIAFEILVSEDAGHQFLRDNNKINSIENCHYKIQKTNLGRAGNINRLINWAQFETKLILDCDVMPKQDHFIKTYIKISKQHNAIACFGGICYQKISDKHNLRYNYGVKREAKLAKKRQKKPFKYLLTSNILLVNINQLFDKHIKTYGYEDLVFSNQLYKKNTKVLHLDNPVYHCNLESNKTYLTKTETAIKTLIKLEKLNILNPGQTNISKLYHNLKRLYLHKVLLLLNPIISQKAYKFLLLNGKPLWLFDLYKLFCFCKNY
ncbi:glycosyltransferase family 2 protein [Psychroflexus sp. MBR-150]